MLATNDQALHEFAFNVGRHPHNINRQWILGHNDVWIKNPHYTGPDQVHPEDIDWDDDEPEEFDCDNFADGEALASAGFGTDEDYGMFNSDDDFHNHNFDC